MEKIEKGLFSFLFFVVQEVKFSISSISLPLKHISSSEKICSPHYPSLPPPKTETQHTYKPLECKGGWKNLQLEALNPSLNSAAGKLLEEGHLPHFPYGI